MVKLLAFSDPIDTAALGHKRTLTIAGRLTVWWPFPIAEGLHSSGGVVFGRAVYCGEESWWIKPVYRVFTRISDARYWLRYRLHPTRYHWLDTGLGPGYADPRTLLLYGAMAALGRYIDEMGGLAEIDKFNAELRDPANFDPNAPGEQGEMETGQASRQEEAATIWRWWTEQLPADKKRRDELLHRLYGNRRIRSKPVEGGLCEIVFREFEGDEVAFHEEFRALEEKIDQDKRAMLHRLVDIRESLWT